MKKDFYPNLLIKWRSIEGILYYWEAYMVIAMCNSIKLNILLPWWTIKDLVSKSATRSEVMIIIQHLIRVTLTLGRIQVFEDELFIKAKSLDLFFCILKPFLYIL